MLPCGFWILDKGADVQTGDGLNAYGELRYQYSQAAAFLEFNVNTMTVITKCSDIDDQLDNLEANFGIHQWVADAKELSSTRMTLSGYREALA